MSGKKIIDGLKEAVEHAHNHQPDKDTAELLADDFYSLPPAHRTKKRLARMIAAGLAAGVPEGWKLIPINPTVKMKKIIDKDDGTFPVHKYAEMLAAAPSPNKEGE